MADGTTYSIKIDATGIGVDATAADINALAASLSAAEAVVTPFDGALSAAQRELTAAGEAANLAAGELSAAEKEFTRLERAAVKAEKAVGVAAAKGKDTSALRAAADEAAAAVTKQGAAVDQAREKAKLAAAAERDLADSFKTVKKASDQSAAGLRQMGSATAQTKRSFGDTTAAATAMGGRFGGLVGMITGVVEGIGRGGKGAGLIAVVVLAAAAVFALVAATIALGVAIVATTAKLIKMAIASREAYSKEFTKQQEKMQKNISNLFLGVRADKLLGPMKLMSKFFDRNTASGRGLATILEKLLNPVIDGLVKAAPLMIEFFKGGIIAALDFIILLLRVRNAVVAMIPKSVREKVKQFVASIDTLAIAGRTGELVFTGLGIALLIVLAPLAVIGGLILLLVVAFFVLAAAIGWVVEAIVSFYDTITDPANVDKFIETVVDAFLALPDQISEALSDAADAVYEFYARITDPAEVERGFKSLMMSIAALVGSIGNAIGPAAAKAGKAFVDGLLEPIRAGKALIRAAAKALGLAAAEGVRSSLEIKSPSRVMQRIGRDTTEGAERGIEDGTDDVQEAMERMLEPGMARQRAADKRGTNGNGLVRAQGNTITVNLTVNAPTGNSDDICRTVEQAMVRIFDGVALQLGGGATPESAGA